MCVDTPGGGGGGGGGGAYSDLARDDPAQAAADEPEELNFVKKHATDLASRGVQRPAARLFSNPPGDYGSMVNERVGAGSWEDSAELGDTWASRNAFSYGRAEADAFFLKSPHASHFLSESGTARGKRVN